MFDPTKPNDPRAAADFFKNKMTYTTGPVELNSMIEQKKEITIIDVRAYKDYAQHIPGAINLPKEEWDTLKGLQKDKLNVVYCYSHVCHLAAKACLEFAERGFPVMEMDGGWKAWLQHKLPVENSAATQAAS
jgi:rhodanese-related sulfurtransferase